MWPHPVSKQHGLSHWDVSNSPHHSRPCLSEIKVSLKSFHKVSQKAENWDRLFRVLLHVLVYPLPASCNFFQDFSATELIRYNELSSRTKIKIINLVKRDISLTVNGIVYQIVLGCVQQRVTFRAFLVRNKKMHWEVWRKWGRDPKKWDCHFFFWLLSNTIF